MTTKKPTTGKKKAAAKARTTAKAKRAAPGTEDYIKEIIGELHYQMDKFTETEEVDSTLTGAVRRRLIGAGVRNYGFIDKVYDIARDNPGFTPNYLTPQEMWEDMHGFEEVRQLVLVLEKFLQLATECMMIKGDKCFRDALAIYDNLKVMAKSNIPGAKPLLDALVSYFRKNRKPGEKELTEKEMERHIHALLRGTADGTFEITNERPQTTAGKREIIDNVHRDRAVFKESAEVDAKD